MFNPCLTLPVPFPYPSCTLPCGLFCTSWCYSPAQSTRRTRPWLVIIQPFAGKRRLSPMSLWCCPAACASSGCRPETYRKNTRGIRGAYRGFTGGHGWTMDRAWGRRLLTLAVCDPRRTALNPARNWDTQKLTPAPAFGSLSEIGQKPVCQEPILDCGRSLKRRPTAVTTAPNTLGRC